MMETKLWIALCALLVINLGTADHTGDHSTRAPTPGSRDPQTVPAASVAEPVPSSSPNLTSHTLNSADANPSHNGTSSLSNTSTVNETISMTSKDNATYNISHPAAAGPDTNKNTTLSQLALPTSESFSITPHTSPSPTSTSTTLTAHASPTTVSSPNHNTSHPMTALPADSPSQPNQNNTHSSTPEPPQTAHTAAGAQLNSTVATIPSHENSTSQPTTNDSSHGQPKLEASSQATPKSTTTNPTSSPSTQAKTHSDMPSQLNVEGDTTMVHDSPTLDPLLAGLVSAFIITAVIITLLLFLKLRRRDNRPEFRRLQDLPMDDMMEDTPLSMYSY